jgi:hypothetical protein
MNLEQINDLSARVLRGEDVSDEELRAALIALRERARKPAITKEPAAAAVPKMTLDDFVSKFSKKEPK